jgi:hypothetical protein
MTTATLFSSVMWKTNDVGTNLDGMEWSRGPDVGVYEEMRCEDEV